MTNHQHRPASRQGEDDSDRPTERRNRRERSWKEAATSGETSSNEAVNRQPDRIGEDTEALIVRFTCWPADNSAGDGSAEPSPLGMSSGRHRRERCRPVRPLFRPSARPGHRSRWGTARVAGPLFPASFGLVWGLFRRCFSAVSTDVQSHHGGSNPAPCAPHATRPLGICPPQNFCENFK